MAEQRYGFKPAGIKRCKPMHVMQGHDRYARATSAALMLYWTSRRRLEEARKAARSRDWAAAAHAYAAYLARRPRAAKAWVQYGHALKEQGDHAGARVAYDRAIALKPDAADAWLQRGDLLRLSGDPAEAIEAYVKAVELDPRMERAQNQLRLASKAGSFPRRDRFDESSRPALFAIDRYDAFRRQVVIPAPSGSQTCAPITVVLASRDALAAQIRSTVSSLLDQINVAWTAVVVVPADLLDHPVASIAEIDRRVSFAGPDDPRLSAPLDGLVLLLDAGTVLDRRALAWFGWAAARTGCVAAYCDHDLSIPDWRNGRRFETPMFQPMFDAEWFADPETEPAALALDADRVPLSAGDAVAVSRQRLLLEAGQQAPVAHLPLLLATRGGIAREAADAPAGATVATSPAPARPTRAHIQPVEGRIAAIVQTRDEPEMLAACVDSLKRRAATPALLDIVIVDNRSRLPETRKLLERLAREGVRVIPLDAPFNWSHANNVAAEVAGDAALLLFLNNDAELLTTGWDARLREALAPSDVGIVGAALEYPDATVQHAGMVFGMGTGGPMHEGVGAPVTDPGPAGRWHRARSAVAVTGALMAMRRTVFEHIGGFDTRLSVAFNDVDICLRSRAAGLRVVQSPVIRAIHHESKTRGVNTTCPQVAWDLEELTTLHERWGDALFVDPGYNPHWTRYGRPFDAYRLPGLYEIVRHIDVSSSDGPWRPVTPATESWW